jgi:AbrB family looped-hinge helix DNA binding protein
MRVTSKGQVTIPKAIRDRAGIRPGMEVEFELSDGEVRLIKIEGSMEDESPGERMVRVLTESARRARTNDISTDEIMEMTRGPFKDLDPG